MADKRWIAARQQRGLLARVQGQRKVAHRIDAAIQPVEDSGLGEAINDVATEAGAKQLISCQNAVLPGCDLGTDIGGL